MIRVASLANPGQGVKMEGPQAFRGLSVQWKAGIMFSIQLLLVSLRSWQVVPGFTMFIHVLPPFLAR